MTSLLIAPDGVVIDDGGSGLNPLGIDSGGKFEIINAVPNAPVLPP